MQFDTETLKAIIQEARKQGYQDDLIAAKLNLDLDDPVFFALNETERSLGLELSGIGEGFREWEFSHLQEDDKRKLLIVMARMAEAFYRRGAQQGWWMCDSGQKLKMPLDKLRFGTEPLDSARMPLCGTRMTSMERLRIQHGTILQALGFDIGDLQ